MGWAPSSQFNLWMEKLTEKLIIKNAESIGGEMVHWDFTYRVE